MKRSNNSWRAFGYTVLIVWTVSTLAGLFRSTSKPMSYTELKKKIMGLLGGRAAEELVFNEVSTGAEDDLRKATDIARSMVTSYGMSATLGCVSLAAPAPSFLVPGVEAQNNYSDAVAHEIDEQVRHIIDDQYRRTRALLTQHLDAVCSSAQASRYERYAASA